MNHRALHVFRVGRPTLLALALVAAGVSHAQTAALGETVVTATRTPARADSLVSDVTVLTREDLQRQPGRSLPEILAREAGVQFAANGGRGKSSSVFLRGTEARHTILLIDGVRYGSATLGTPVWENLPLDAIERIEVVKGPASSLYGSDGVGGVVQIFTRQGRQGFHPYAELSAGSRGYTQGAAGFSAGQGAFSGSLGLQALNDRSFSATNPAVPFGNYNPDRDPFRQRSVNAQGAWSFAPDWKLEGGLLHAEGTSHFDDGPGRDSHSKVRTSLLRANVNGRVTGDWQTRVQLARSRDVSNAVVASVLPSDFETTQDQLLWQNDLATALGVAQLGLERLEQQVDGSTAYAVRERTINSAFAGLNGEAGVHGWQASLRHDRNSQFGPHTTGFAGYGIRFAPAWRAHASYGTSFVAPSFNQLYFPRFGNPTLQPEEGRNREFGLTWSPGDHTVKLVRFDNRIRGFIPSGPLPANVPRARIDGWTLSWDGRFADLGLRAAYDRLDPRNQLTGRKLPRRADEQVTLGADWRAGAWTLGGSLLYVGERFDDAANNVRLGAYTTVDLFATYALARDWTLQASLRNAADREYSTVRGYNQPGRAFVATLRWQPK
ncbi:TonB-dependent receptor domain-containing protein [Ramlibacter tataouinensis]|nr:TonB-dependent receptor [Ramlibacter tataouinensis]